jgi:hypothetical protein
MTGDNPAWLVARAALDHHDTVIALTEAMPDAVAYADDPEARGRLATHVAAELARRGFALVPLSPARPETLDDKMAAETATEWFGREQDG